MIDVGDLVEWTEMTNAKRTTDSNYVNGRAQLRDVFIDPVCYGIVLKVKTESLDGLNRTKLFKVHFPDRQQYWIVSDNLNKIS